MRHLSRYPVNWPLSSVVDGRYPRLLLPSWNSPVSGNSVFTIFGTRSPRGT